MKAEGRAFLVVVPGGPASIPAIQQQTRLLRTRFSQVEIVSLGQDLPGGAATFMPAWPPGKNLLSRVARHLRAQMQLGRFLRREATKSDTIIFSLGTGAAPLAFVQARRTKAFIVLWLASEPGYVMTAGGRYVRWLPTKIFTSMARRASTIVVYSHNLANHPLLERWRDRVYVADHHAIDLNRFAIGAGPRQATYTIGFVGRWSHEKGIDRFLDAAVQLADGPHEHRILVLGGGPRDRDVRAVADRLTGRLAVLGWVDHDELPKVLATIGLLVMPSRTEGLPNLLLEAMACGTPVLSTPVGAIPDIVDGHSNGFLWEPDGSVELAEAIMNSLDAASQSGMRSAAHRTIAERFSWPAVEARFRRVPLQADDEVNRL